MNLAPLFAPRSLAVIGVSAANDRHPANVIFAKNLLRYPVATYAVNSKGGFIDGEKVFPSVSAIPDTIDLAVIAVRAEFVPGVLQQCMAAKVKSAVVISGGFAEAGREDLQDNLVNMAREGSFPFIGPNCLGIYSPGVVDTFFLPAERMVHPLPGDVAVVSQSGGMLVDLLVKFAGEGVGVSSAVSIGNKALIGEEQLLDFLDADPRTRVIAFYIEGFARNEGRDFVRRAARCSKPVIVFKAGRTNEGGRAVSSHTASLAGDYRVFSSVLAQHGIIEAKNELELVSCCEALSCYPETVIEGRVGIISGSGGHGAIAVDACISGGLMVPRLGEEARQSLRNILSENIRGIASVANPVDLTGSAVENDFISAVEFFCTIPDIDTILLLLLPYLPAISSDLGARLSKVYRRHGKPLIAYVPHIEKYRMFTEGFELNRVPVASSIESAVHMTRTLRRCRPC
ncbi:MAG: CoA-binding protein [Deltaproteobacteria bacterium]|nr:CoA-binding protein [Deltaproteobacteria bacterium]